MLFLMVNIQDMLSHLVDFFGSTKVDELALSTIADLFMTEPWQSLQSTNHHWELPLLLLLQLLT